MALAGECLRSQAPTLLVLGSFMYRVIFREFRHLRVVQALSAHIGSGNRLEIDWALRALMSLAEQCPEHLRACLPSIRHLLDFVYSFNYHQLKSIWKIIAKLGVSSDPRNAPVDDAENGEPEFSSAGWLWVYIRKGLHSSEVFTQRSGILGGLALLAELLPTSVDDDLSGSVDARVEEEEEEEELFRGDDGTLGSFFETFTS